MQPPGISLKKRIVLLFILSFFGVVLLSGRLVWIQFVHGEELRKEASELRMRDVQVTPNRGIIYDRNGRELAISVNVESVYAIPAEVRSNNPDEICAELASILELDAQELKTRITASTSFAWVKRKIDPEKATELKALRLPGIGFTQESRRYYPNNELLAQVLGFSGIDNQGLEGIEVTYDDELRGELGFKRAEFDARGIELPQTRREMIPPVDGQNLYLTIDEVIQYIAERELDRLMLDHNPKRAAIIVVDPSTGDILAMAQRPTYDPNKALDYPQKQWRNIMVSDTYSPGSVFKIVTASAAVDSGVMTPSTPFYDPGYVKVPGHTITNWNGRGLGSTTLTEGIKKSSNVVLATVGLALGMDRFYTYLDRFGFGETLGIDLPGEARGIIPKKESARPIDLAVMAFGQTLTVTPLQMAMALSAIANDGVMMQPRLALKFTDVDGNVTSEPEPTARRRVISKEAAQAVKEMMRKVVEEEGGTGSRARIAGWYAGGKTGTAEKVINGRLVEGRYISSFAGFAPADNPRVAILVVADEPEGIYYGSWVAAPAFAAVAADVLHYLEVPYDYDPREYTPPDAWWVEPVEPAEPVVVEVPNVTNLGVQEAGTVLRSSGLVSLVQGLGDRVFDQFPPSGVEVEEGTSIILYTTPQETGPAPTTTEIMVPDLTGMTMREVADVLSALDLRLEPAGSGVASSQDPVPGARVAPGSTIRVQFAPEGGE